MSLHQQLIRCGLSCVSDRLSISGTLACQRAWDSRRGPMKPLSEASEKFEAKNLEYEQEKHETQEAYNIEYFIELIRIFI